MRNAHEVCSDRCNSVDRACSGRLLGLRHRRPVRDGWRVTDPVRCAEPDDREYLAEYRLGIVTVEGEIDRRATATVGGIAVPLGWSPTDASRHLLVAPPHGAGPVDVVVTNPEGGSHTAAGGYTYVEPGAAPLDGEWSGVTVDGSDTSIEFTVRDQRLTSVRCVNPSEQSLAIDLSQAFVNGKVEVMRDEGRFSAWSVSPSETAGTIDMRPCSGVLRWAAGLRSSPRQMRR